MRVVIIGAGKVGFEIAHRLSQENHDVVLVDKNADALAEAATHLDVLTVTGNGASPRLQEQLSSADTDLLVAVTESDEVNMVACFTAKRHGIRKGLARIRNPEYSAPLPHGLPLAALGIDQVINPEALAAQEIQRLLHVPFAAEVDTFANDQITMVGLDIHPESPVVGVALSKAHLRDALIVAAVRGGKVIIPTGDTELMPSDRLFVVVATRHLSSLQPLVGKENKSIRRVAIAGGGRIGSNLARLLTDDGEGQLKIMLFEKDPRRAEHIARRFPRALVVHGDATKIDVLRGEGAVDCDAFVSVAGEDHTNLLGTMLAHELHIPQIITEVTREDYVPLARRAGAKAVVVPRLLTIGNVLRHVHSQNIVSITLLREGLAEVLEIIAPKEGPFIGKPLHRLHFPPGTIVGAVMKGGQAHIAQGSTVIEPGDRVVIFALPHIVDRIEHMLRPRYG